MVGKWLLISHENDGATGRLFKPHIRTRVTCALRLAGAACGVEGSHFGPHSMRIGEASAMFSAGYDVDITKRWGRWPSSTFQQYIWRDQYVMSTIGRGIFDAIRMDNRSTGRAGGGGKRKGGVRESQQSPNA